MNIMAILILLITSSAWGQTTIRGTTTFTTHGISSDTVNHSPNNDFESRINLRPIDSSDYDFEIRFYNLTVVTNNRNLRIVRLAKGEWEALEFEENRSKIRSHTLVANLGFETFLVNLTKYNFTTLPNQSEVDRKIENSFASKKEYLQSRPSVMDGHVFTIEFKIADKFRVYQFANPESYSKYYDNQELKDYVALQKLFDQELTRK